jgi:lysophospholipid acyltransferase (LPLAT)-like uncharacterized protein
MLKKFAKWLRRKITWWVAMVLKYFIHLIIWTCRVQLNGLNQFQELGSHQKCLLMLWHNRLVLTPFLLSRYTPQFTYAALVSNSRDGNLLSDVIHSYPNGKTIRVSHHARFHALANVINHVKQTEDIVIITPDGPRGPSYQIKPGIAITARETKTHVVPFNWEAAHYWELKTWDGLRIPKPFTTIQVYFHPSLDFKENAYFSIQKTQALLKSILPH